MTNKISEVLYSCKRLLKKYVVYCYYCAKILYRQFKESNKRIRKYPITIQLPITFKCNFDCVMCGMRSLQGKSEITHEDLDKILSDRLYSRVVSVGVNGGEPFLKKDLIECVSTITEKLPRLKRLNFISNGYFTDIMLESLPVLKTICQKKNVSLHLSISVDGVGEVQDFHRGMKGAFDRVESTLDAIMVDKSRYVDYLNIICTITRYNVFYLSQISEWVKRKCIDIEYNIATENVRISNTSKVNDFSLFSDDEALLLATEFFYTLFLKTKKEKYFGLYLYLKYHKRYSGCPCKENDWVTVTPDGKIGYCATHSKELGDGLKQSSFKIFNSQIGYLEELKNTYCESCSHYLYCLDSKGLRILKDEMIKKYKY